MDQIFSINYSNIEIRTLLGGHPVFLHKPNPGSHTKPEKAAATATFPPKTGRHRKHLTFDERGRTWLFPSFGSVKSWKNVSLAMNNIFRVQTKHCFPLFKVAAQDIKKFA